MAQVDLNQVSNYSDYLHIVTSTGVDTNDTASVTPTISFPSMSSCAVFVDNESGGATTHVVTVQTSHDGTVWVNESNAVTGAGTAKNTGLIASKIRAKVTTGEGGASISTITLIIK